MASFSAYSPILPVAGDLLVPSPSPYPCLPPIARDHLSPLGSLLLASLNKLGMAWNLVTPSSLPSFALFFTLEQIPWLGSQG